MPRLAILFMLALAFAATEFAAPTQAADLAARHARPRPSSIGMIFADPVVVVAEPAGTPFVYAPLVDIPPLVNGYYGKVNSYYYSSYYGTPSQAIYGRLPYACGLYGYC
ncbi:MULTISPECIES: hypothetical protein [Rhodopseudomonas]|uniref:Uncharacterized protein n=1 Tax=Rhodopseudomonas palustris TaxID=1076 RepID=A0A0D7EL99_RHOPL|nr:MULTISPECIES: hypothetical protein [Rhodopseudomonas]KIZ40217.1 hypothetical protein OO17_18280 [Rhodopseudomonas palustris]MDF3812123.1 hypothetical protein [Rhodopseudomonas sp. BAL398]WOK19972.1 hypothetical protein RBJ75_10835 [Rhodopseudomonas sp. BAL398]